MYVTIIVPIYNSEKYLEECLNSIINQTYKKIEIILINDGSTDNSLKKIKEYQKNDQRIKVFNNENHGVSFTRNFGIDEATGDYIMFVDSDDYISKNYVENMLKPIINENYELVISGITYCDDSKKILKKDISSYSNQEINFKMIENEFINTSYFCSSCKNMIKRNLALNNKFNEKLKFGEDYLFSYNLLHGAKKIFYLNDTGYFYRQNQNSVTHINDIKNIYKYLDDNFYIFNIFNEKNIDKKYINNRLIVKYNICLKKIAFSNSINYNDFKMNINDINKKYNIYNLFKYYNGTIIRENFINKFLIKLLKNKLYFVYYKLCLVIKKIKSR